MPADSKGKVLVTGATGAIGPSVVQALRESGYQVRALSRTPAEVGLLPDDVEVRIGDILDPETVRSAVQGVEAILHLAGLLHIVSPTDSLRDSYEQINVRGTATIVDAAIRAGTKRLVFFSTIAVYGYLTGQVISEDTKPQPGSFYAQTKLDAEKIVLSAKRADNHSLGVVLRLGAVYGARVKGNYRRLLRALARGRFVHVGDGRNRRTLIHDSDVGRSAVLAMCCPKAAGKIYNVSDGEFHTLNQIISTICDLLGRRGPTISVPLKPARFVAGVLEDFQHAMGRKSQIGRHSIDKYTEDVAVDSQRIELELGFKPKVDLVTGWRQTIDEMRKSGEL